MSYNGNSSGSTGSPQIYLGALRLPARISTPTWSLLGAPRLEVPHTTTKLAIIT